MAKSTYVALGIVAVAWLVSAPGAHAQPLCTSCNDFSAWNGWTSSPPCFGNCSDPHCPKKDCFSAVPPADLAAALHPGIVTEQRGGRLYVAGLLNTSPAGRSGIRPGDELVSLNGAQVGRSFVDGAWEGRETPGVARIAVRRSGRDVAMDIKLQPLGEIVRNALAASGDVRTVALSGAMRSRVPGSPIQFETSSCDARSVSARADSQGDTKGLSQLVRQLAVVDSSRTNALASATNP